MVTRLAAYRELWSFAVCTWLSIIEDLVQVWISEDSSEHWAVACLSRDRSQVHTRLCESVYPAAIPTWTLCVYIPSSDSHHLRSHLSTRAWRQRNGPRCRLRPWYLSSASSYNLENNRSNGASLVTARIARMYRFCPVCVCVLMPKTDNLITTSHFAFTWGFGPIQACPFVRPDPYLPPLHTLRAAGCAIKPWADSSLNMNSEGF